MPIIFVFCQLYSFIHMILILLISLLLVSVHAKPSNAVQILTKPFQNSHMKSLISLVIGETCYNTFIMEGDFTNIPCLKYSVSKGLGYGIVVGSGIMKLPQIIKIMSNRDVTGLNAMSFYMECAAFLPSIVYNYLKGYPLSTYGESVIILFQNILLVSLFWNYAKLNAKKSTCHICMIILSFIVFTVVLFYCPQKYLTILPLTGTLSAVFARVPQILSNWKQGHTGQLSFITWLFTFCGSSARIFTTLQEVDDPIIASSYIISTICNAILVLQIILYWKATNELKQKKE